MERSRFAGFPPALRCTGLYARTTGLTSRSLAGTSASSSSLFQPGNGRRGLAVLRPGLRVVFVSGYTDAAAGRDVLLKSGSIFLQKPFTLAALGSRIRQALDSSART